MDTADGHGSILLLLPNKTIQGNAVLAYYSKIHFSSCIFLRRGGSITSRVAVHRHYSTDLDQGLTFSSPC